MKTIQIIITPRGETQVTTYGFSGPECQEASRFIEKALGTKVRERLLSEYHQSEPSQQVDSQQA